MVTSAPAHRIVRWPVPRWVVVAIVLFAIGESLLLGYSRVSAAATHLQVAQERIRVDLDGVQAGCEEFQAAMTEVGPLVSALNVARLVPLERVRAWGELPRLAGAAEHGCNAVAHVGTVAEAMRPASVGSPGAAVLAGLHTRPGEIEQASRELATALDVLASVNPTTMSAEPRLRLLAEVVTSAQGRLAELRIWSAVLPEAPDLAARLLGGDGRSRRYLLVGQNNDELRATGGFIGTLGTVTVQDGRIVAKDVRSSYLWEGRATPRAGAPEALQRYMNFGGWYLRDANWWVDYRRSAAQLLLLWGEAQGDADAIDGVIALDRPGLETLLGAVDGVYVPELGGQVDQGNVGEVLDQRRRSREAVRSYDDYQRVKTEALSGVVDAMLARVASTSSQELTRVLLAAGRAAANRHLLLWFRDPALEAAAARLAWDGRVDPGPGDFVGVVDTALSYGKVTPFITRTVDYQRRADGTSVVTVHYANHYRPAQGAAWDTLVDGTWWDWRAGVFRREQGAWLTYTRILAPTGASLLDASGWDDAPTLGSEGDLAIIGAPVLVRPGESRRVEVVYANPAPAAPLTRYRQPDPPER